MNELRRNPRVLVDRSINVVLSDGGVARARIVNISVDGLAISYPASADTGTELGLSFQIPSHDDIYTINVHGIVRHTHIQGNNYIIGIEFKNMNPDDRSLISRFISNKLNNTRT